jgi:hypothetical protein
MTCEGYVEIGRSPLQKKRNVFKNINDVWAGTDDVNALVSDTVVVLGSECVKRNQSMSHMAL